MKKKKLFFIIININEILSMTVCIEGVWARVFYTKALIVDFVIESATKYEIRRAQKVFSLFAVDYLPHSPKNYGKGSDEIE